jgi:hypothetical protein
MLGLGAVMLLACLGGPAPPGAIGGLGVGVMVGPGGVVCPLALCAAVPAVMVVLRLRSARWARAEVVGGSAASGSTRG